MLGIKKGQMMYGRYTIALCDILGFSALVSSTDRDSLTITIGLRKLAETFGHQERNLGLKMAGAWVGGIPILIFYFIFQRRIVDGIRLTSGFK